MYVPRARLNQNLTTQEFISPNTSFNRQFLDLLQRIFVYDPKQRITAKQALKHPWFKESIVDDGVEAQRIGKQRPVVATAVRPNS